jgi:hypothetical protein
VQTKRVTLFMTGVLAALSLSFAFGDQASAQRVYLGTFPDKATHSAASKPYLVPGAELRLKRETLDTVLVSFTGNVELSMDSEGDPHRAGTIRIVEQTTKQRVAVGTILRSHNAARLIIPVHIEGVFEVRPGQVYNFGIELETRHRTRITVVNQTWPATPGFSPVVFKAMPIR